MRLYLLPSLPTQSCWLVSPLPERVPIPVSWPLAPSAPSALAGEEGDAPAALPWAGLELLQADQWAGSPPSQGRAQESLRGGSAPWPTSGCLSPGKDPGLGGMGLPLQYSFVHPQGLASVTVEALKCGARGHGVLGHQPIVTTQEGKGRAREGAGAPGLCCCGGMPLNPGFCFCSGTLKHEVQGVP